MRQGNWLGYGSFVSVCMHAAALSGWGEPHTKIGRGNKTKRNETKLHGLLGIDGPAE